MYSKIAAQASAHVAKSASWISSFFSAAKKLSIGALSQQSARRLMTQDISGDWRVTLFDATAVARTGRLLLLGGGEARFDLSRGVTEPLSEGQLRELGLDRVAKQWREEQRRRH